MLKVSAKDLYIHHRVRFEEEYSKWVEYAMDWDWWESFYEGFKEDMSAEGITVSRINFNISYSQGDYASFEGHIEISDFMEHGEYHLKYPALHAAAKDYGDWAVVSNTYRHGLSRVCWDANVLGSTRPSGIFTGLANESWDELITEQFYEAGLEFEMQAYVDDKCKELYRTLRAEYEHLTSEESFIDHCECNEVMFEIETEGKTNEAYA